MEKYCNKILELKAFGIHDASCAIELGVSLKTFKKLMQNEKFSEAYNKGVEINKKTSTNKF